jgi:hypothetical protein
MEIHKMREETPGARLTGVLRALDIATSTWYRRAVPERGRPGPKPKPIPEEVVRAVVEMATENPWYGYQKIAVMCRREDEPVKDRQAYSVMLAHDLLHKRLPRKAELHQASKLYELLPQGPNELWQMDVTYIHIPGYGWWYAVTVIDYFSRYLLACHLTTSYSAIEAMCAFRDVHLCLWRLRRQAGAISTKEVAHGEQAAGSGAGTVLATGIGVAGQERPEHSGILSAGEGQRAVVLRLATGDRPA